MLVIDTNLIVRYLTGDHPEQSPKARALIDREDVFVCTTVLLETEWVLHSAYGYTPSQIGTALTAFAGLPQVTLEMPLSRDGSRLDDQRARFCGHAPSRARGGMYRLYQL